VRYRTDRDDRGISDVCEHAIVVICRLTDQRHVSLQIEPSASRARRQTTVLLATTDASAVRSGQIHDPGSWFVAP
jgi:hypothetical protein